eukprot:scaffold99935_cov19-Tisochrysis_lutea.AAC.1
MSDQITAQTAPTTKCKVRYGQINMSASGALKGSQVGTPMPVTSGSSSTAGACRPSQKTFRTIRVV